MKTSSQLVTPIPSEKQSLVPRIAPAVSLFLLAPLVAEFLLGNLPIKLLPALVLLAPLYGGGALLIRELARRSGRGWPSILLLGMAYMLVEEGFTTQSLFNPNYLLMNLHLLTPAYVPALGMGAWWTVFMLNLHTVWSIATPVALVEAAVPARASKPWLGRTGLAVTALLFAGGVAGTTLLTIKKDPFIASHAQFVSAAVIAVLLIMAAFLLPRLPVARDSGWVPNPWVTGCIALVLGSAVLLVPTKWGSWAAYALVGIDLIGLVLVLTWSRRGGWDARHRLALGAGAALAYAWHAFIEVPVVGGSLLAARVGNVIFAVGAVLVIWLGARRTDARSGVEGNSLRIPLFRGTERMGPFEFRKD